MAEQIARILLIFVFVDELDENEEDHENKDGIKKDGVTVKIEKDSAGNAIDRKDGQMNAKTEKELKEAQRAKELKIAESEMVRDMKAQLK